MTILDELRAKRQTHGEAAPSYFHKTKEGQYQAQDVFWEIATPAIREILKRHEQADEQEIESLLQSEIHEARTCAIALLTRRFRNGSKEEKERIFRYYLSRLDRVNGWDLVDISCPEIVGGWILETGQDAILDELSRSSDLWRRRVAVVSTLKLIQSGNLDPTFRIVEKLLGDSEDLIHKACGWMLREAGKPNPTRLNRFLRDHYTDLPRTTLRYAIERHEPAQRQEILKGIFREE
jgi:3-methyladenine DNA glycosylase AlkD